MIERKLHNGMGWHESKNWKRRFLPVMALALTLGCAGGVTDSTDEAFIQSPGVHEQLLSPSNKRYTIAIPSDYT